MSGGGPILPGASNRDAARTVDMDASEPASPATEPATWPDGERENFNNADMAVEPLHISSDSNVSIPNTPE